MKQKQNIYMVGIKGVGMTMLAQFLSQTGHQLSGSDIKDVFLTDKVLRQEKIKVMSPFSIKNIPAQIDLVIYSSAFNIKNNVELAALKKNKKINLKSYAEALADVFNNHYGIAVCGSHGKTTISAWLGYLLQQAGKSPQVLVGSYVPQFQGSGLQGRSKLLIAETDEYQNKLQYFLPQAVVLSNIDFDHPDFFPTKASYTKVFRDFIKKIPQTGFLVINNDNREAKNIKKYCSGQTITYGINDDESSSRQLDYRAHNIRQTATYQFFQVNDWGEFKIRLWGQHNISNALAVIAGAKKLGVSLAKIKKYLASFKGTDRRTQIMGKYHGAIIIDDYAHHPTEIKATLAGLRKHYPHKNIITIFHPHTFTRTKALFSDFITSFSEADELIVLDIYGSAREQLGGVSSRKLVKEIIKFNQKNNIKQSVHYLPELALAQGYLAKNLKDNDLALLMGAGDVFRIGWGLLK